MRKQLVFSLSLLFFTAMALSQPVENGNQTDIEFEEETVDISEDVPSSLAHLVPGQRINVEINQTDKATVNFPEELSVIIDSSLEEVTVRENHTENPTFEVVMGTEVLAQELSHGQIIQHIRQGNIEYKAHGTLMGGVSAIADRTIFR